MSAEKILVIDDTPINIAFLTEILEPSGYEILTASSAEQGFRIAVRSRPDLILLDIVMPGRDGYSVCRQLKENLETKDIPVLFVSALHEVQSLLQGFRAGAVDYILKPFQGEEVGVRVETHLRIARLNRELKMRNQQLEAEVTRRQAAESASQMANERLSSLSDQEVRRWGLEEFVGRSPLLSKILQDIERLHQFGGTNVIILGESGTGKELVARAIHYRSSRGKGPFICMNCVAIPMELAESTLFGHVRGAFTGATSDRRGCFDLADGGTLFLDEVGDMPMGLQGKLLRVLEDGEVTPVGSTQSKRVDVRVVAATNADLARKIGAGEFREDFYFRLARYTVKTPPLRERPEDIPLLAEHFLGLFAREMGLIPPCLTPKAQTLLQNYNFPGNIRELKNVIERALIESEGHEIGVEHLTWINSIPRKQMAVNVEALDHATRDLPFNLEAAEKELIRRAIDQAGGNIAEAARLLGVNRSRIYRRFNDSF